MLALLLFLALFLPAQRLDPAAVAERVQRVYEESEAFRCDFQQFYRSGTTGKVTEASGELLIKKPGKMRWDYRSPERKLYISDGEVVYWYLPEDRQVTRMSLEDADQQQAEILFLTGRGDLLRDFDIAYEEEHMPLYESSHLIRLLPKGEESFDYIVLEVNPSDYFVERMIVVDAFGNSTDYRFLNIRPVEVEDKLFVFVIPKGVEVFEGQ